MNPPARESLYALRILVVEDHTDTADSLYMLLELWAFDSELARTAEDAVTAYRQFQPHVVLMDLGLPGMSGIDLARRFREQADLPRPTIIALTGFADAEHREQTKADFDDYLLKPIDPAALRDRLAAYARNLASEQDGREPRAEAMPPA